MCEVTGWRPEVQEAFSTSRTSSNSTSASSFPSLISGKDFPAWFANQIHPVTTWSRAAAFNDADLVFFDHSSPLPGQQR